jgi:DNA-binding transcriptional LysR family regulator
MSRINMNDLVAFTVIARERSFTRAAAQLGVSPSALSHSMRILEERLGVRLLTRTTRSVSPTEAGDRMLASVGARLEEINEELDSLIELSDRPAGTVRITAIQYSAEHILLPKLEKVLRDYPDIKVEISIDYGLSNIVTGRFDAGVRGGEQIDKDMIAMRISPDMRMIAVASPSYFKQHPIPESPQDLMEHNCINMRLPSTGSLYAWEFEKDGREIRAKVEGQLVLNSASAIMKAAVLGFGIAFLPEEQVATHLTQGSLICVLSDWCPIFPGYHIYYPSRKQLSPAFSIVLDALCERL